MPFDPTKPVPGQPLDADLIRAQLLALKAEIDALAAQLAAAIASTANNIPGISNLGLIIGNNPPQQSDVQPIADKLDELMNALRRV